MRLIRISCHFINLKHQQEKPSSTPPVGTICIIRAWVIFFCILQASLNCGILQLKPKGGQVGRGRRYWTCIEHSTVTWPQSTNKCRFQKKKGNRYICYFGLVKHFFGPQKQPQNRKLWAKLRVTHDQIRDIGQQKRTQHLFFLFWLETTVSQTGKHHPNHRQPREIFYINLNLSQTLRFCTALNPLEGRSEGMGARHFLISRVKRQKKNVFLS